MTLAEATTWPRADFSRIPYRVYIDQEVYDREQEQIFRGPVWNYLGLDCEIEQPGDFKTSFLGDVPIVVNRDREGVIHAFINRCSHRGATLRREARGNSFEHRCVYHQWLFDNAGTLQSIPFRRGVGGKGGMPKDFELCDHNLTSIRVETYNGVMFGTLSDATPPLQTYLGEPMIRHLDRLFNRKLRVLGYMRQDIQANWKLYIDNTKDPYHAGLLHHFHATFGLWRPTQIGGVMFDETRGNTILFNLGGDYDAAEAAKQYQDAKKYTPTEYDLADPALLAGRPDFPDGIANMIMLIYPNFLIQQIMNTMATRQIRPRGPNAFELYWTYFGYADDDEEMVDIRLHQANLVGPSGHISMEDSEAIELIQASIQSYSKGHSVVEMGGRGCGARQDRLFAHRGADAGAVGAVCRADGCHRGG